MTQPVRLLVTGLSGFVGRALSEHWQALGFDRNFELVAPGSVELQDSASVQRMVERTRPQAVLHLAAQSFVPAAFHHPGHTFDVNLKGTLHLLQSLQRQGFTGRLLFVSSADVYGAVPESQLPVAETHLPEPRNPYAVSKLAAEALCRQWFFSEGMDIVVARPFNHVGAGQDHRFVLSGFARQAVRIQLGKEPARIDVGNLDVTRDFTAVEDVLAAYHQLLLHGRSGEVYNVSSGVEQRLSALLHQTLSLAGVEAEIVIDPARLRPNEQLRMRGSAERLQGHTGWQPRIPLEQSLQAMLAWWHQKESLEP